MRLLIADSHLIFTTVAKEIITRLKIGSSITEVNRQQDLYLLLEDNEYDVIIININFLPIKVNDSIIIAISSFDRREESFTLGAKYFLLKPFNFNLLKDILHGRY